MFKKVISLLLCLSMSFALCACDLGKTKGKTQEEKNAEKVENVEEAIDAIGEVTLESKDAIDTARTSYDELDTGLQSEVSNVDTLTAAEEKYELLETVDFDFKSISSENPDMLDADCNEIYSTTTTAALALIMLQLEASEKDYIVTEKFVFSDMYVCRNSSEQRLDFLMPYNNSTEIVYLRYWPDKSKAEFGSKKLDISTEEFAEILVEAEVVDTYKEIPSSTYRTVLNELSNYVN